MPDDDEQISTEEAARLLFVSHPYLVKLLDAHGMPYVEATQEGRRRMRRIDVLRYGEELKVRQRAALEALVKASEAMRLYDVKPIAPRAPEG